MFSVCLLFSRFYLVLNVCIFWRPVKSVSGPNDQFLWWLIVYRLLRALLRRKLWYRCQLHDSNFKARCRDSYREGFLHNYLRQCKKLFTQAYVCLSNFCQSSFLKSNYTIGVRIRFYPRLMQQ